ncbi:MAG: glutathione S-transferase family protein [Myxococcota bacterium]
MTPTSPFARKVRVQLRETGLEGEVEDVDHAAAKLAPTAPVDALNAENPLGKIPALEVPGLPTLFDSRVIARFLDTRHRGTRLLPEEGPERFRDERLEALADGIVDAVVLARYELVLRPEALRWPSWLEAQLDKARRGVAALAESPLADEPTLGTVAAAVCLAYLDFRWAEHDLWRGPQPGLVPWFERFAERPSMVATRFPA